MSASRDLVLRPSGKPVGEAGVFQVVEDMEPHGLTRVTLDVARALLAVGARSVIGSQGGPLVGEARIAGSEHVVLPAPSFNPLRAVTLGHGMHRVIESHRIDIVHIRTPLYAPVARRRARRAGLKTVATVHAPPPAKPGMIERRRWQALLDSDHLIAVSDFVARAIRSFAKIPDDRLTVIHRGIDLGHFNPAAVKAQRLIDLARRHSLPDDRTIILAAGRISPRRGYEVLVDAIARCGRRDIFCLILGSDEGDGAVTRALEARIEAAGLGGLVRFGGHVDDMPAAYMLADVVVVPSLEPEAFGRVCVEAQAMGRPVVASAHGGARETVIEGETGWLVPPGDAAALASALGQALSLDPEHRRKMALATRGRVVEHFARDRMCDQVLAIYERLLATRVEAP